MCSKILQTAVIGLGRIGWQTHLPLLQKNTDKFRTDDFSLSFGFENAF